MRPQYLLTLRCPDEAGIIHAVTAGLLQTGSNILEQAQFTDEDSGMFFLRTRFDSPSPFPILQSTLFSVTEKFNPALLIRNTEDRKRILLMVSRQDHCLTDLLYRHGRGELPIDIPLIISNHDDCKEIADRYHIPYLVLPITPETKKNQETHLLSLVNEHRIDAIVLARYMQILSPELCQALPGRIINIHHSFLPGFKGANPYQQAHDRGVKIIGATAHYVTEHLDEGPIIEQEIQRVTHQENVTALMERGRDLERVVLARAVRLVAEDRVFLDGIRTVIFP